MYCTVRLLTEKSHQFNYIELELLDEAMLLE